MRDLTVKKGKKKTSRGKKKERMQIPTPIVRIEPLLLSAKNVALMLGVSERYFHDLNKAGTIGPLPFRKFKNRILWNKRELDAWVTAGCPNREQWMKIKEGR